MKNLLIVDLESTCFEHENETPKNFNSEIIEIGAVVLNPKTFEVVEEYQCFIKPTLFPTLSDFCKKLTSIKQTDVDNGISASQAMTEIGEFQKKHEAVFCSWGFYDKKQFKNVCKTFNISYPFTPAHISLKHQHGEFENTRPMGMGRALKGYKIPLEGTHHRGIDDARNIAKIASEMIKKGWTHEDLI